MEPECKAGVRQARAQERQRNPEDRKNGEQGNGNHGSASQVTAGAGVGVFLFFDEGLNACTVRHIRTGAVNSPTENGCRDEC